MNGIGWETPFAGKHVRGHHQGLNTPFRLTTYTVMHAMMHACYMNSFS